MLLDGHNSLCYHVLKGNYPNKFLSESKTSVLDAAADWIFGAAVDCSPKGGRF